MAEAFGGRLLSEHQTTNLNDLLSSLSASLPLPHNPLVPNIPFLKDLLGHAETPHAEPGPPRDSRDIPSSPSPVASPHHDHETTESTARYMQPPFIEILSSTTNASRTHLLTYLLSSLLGSPAENGNSKGIVVYIDCSFKLPINSLRASLLQSGHNSATADEALSRLHILQPSSIREVLGQLRKLEDYLFTLDRKDVTLVGIVIADLGVFYWSERWAEEESRLNGPGEKILSRESMHSMIVEVIGRLQKTFGCMVIVSGLGIPIKNADREEGARSGLTKSWERVIDIRIVLSRAKGQIEAKIDARRWLATCQAPTTSSGQAHLAITSNTQGLPQISTRNQS